MTITYALCRKTQSIKCNENNCKHSVGQISVRLRKHCDFKVNILKEVAKMSNSDENRGFETKAIHAGQEYDQWSNREIIPPIVTTLTFFQDDPTNMQVSVGMHARLHRKRFICYLIGFTFFILGSLLWTIQQSNPWSAWTLFGCIG